MSVLTAWAAGKLSSSTIKKTFDELDIANKIKNRTLIYLLSHQGSPILNT